MLNDVRQIAIFAEVIKQGSFRAAARTLGLSPSVVSYHVSQLEQALGTALIYRTTRKLSLTYEGNLLYQHAAIMQAQTQQVLDKVKNIQGELSGNIIITLPAAATRAPITQKLSEFLKLYPKVNASILFTDVRQDLIANNIDLAIRAGEVADSSFKCRRVGQIDRKLVAAPSYLEGKNIHQPSDLDTLSWVKLSMMPVKRVLNHRQMDRQAEITIQSHVIVDSVDAMATLCQYGLGVSSPPDYLVDDALEAGELTELLKDWFVPPIPLYALWPNNVTASSVTKRLIDYIAS